MKMIVPALGQYALPCSLGHRLKLPPSRVGCRVPGKTAIPPINVSAKHHVSLL
jgi:hypothetical protein